ncbi:hypothetical protein EHQ53_00130 [Leptospira langatensis]|uniref:Lipoprotein n=1 Tax=Leptospira langatensis TaxID=2484983 RepID=A0A5F1ZWQ3_9LEPT|nr:hypothetical protein [Leptospira langatensis]TGJ98180.1 hypothetical protein EHO57_16275 [Leptospira langatensis]TGL43094.1 hypothetical protein EHQ53_00130 [Leptospira langatensis]
MILNLKRGLLLLILGILLSGIVSSACKPGGGNGLIPLFNLPHVEKSKTGYFIIVPQGIAQ